ncbi:LOW QUALITY PROTEIN: hypothetical protein V1477_012137 [Vespula maculifrons]|uniref:Uncharacterized protein n=1 Tax=Vespula maculifrons TaxID=7453 RepID=A0ABD2BWM4_VESMC
MLKPILDLIATENTNAYASRHKRVSFYLARTGEKKSFYARVPPWSLGDETDAARGNTRTNGDSTLKSTIRDAFPLRELRASQQTGDKRNFGKTLKYAAIRPVVLAFYNYMYNVVIDFNFRYNSDIDFNIYGKYYRPRSHRVESITVGLLFAPENTTSVPADTGVRVLPILPQSIMKRTFGRYIGTSPIYRNPRRRGKEEEKESRNMRARESDKTQKNRKKGYPEVIMKHLRKR